MRTFALNIVSVSIALTTVVALTAVSIAAQTAAAPRAKAASAGAKKYLPPRTPWGDPDLQGVFTNNDESGIPLERPNQFDGKKLEDVSEGELQQLRDQREEQRVAVAPNLGGVPVRTPCTGSRTSVRRTVVHGSSLIPPTVECHR